MKVINLTENSKRYTSNVYLVLGSWNTMEDVNTLIDVGSDPMILSTLESINTGLGKKKVDQVILTHSHSDHMAMLGEIIDAYNPLVFAFNPHIKGLSRVLKDKDTLRIADRMFEVYHISVHSYDSIGLYCNREGILFTGDTAFPVQCENEALLKDNKAILERLAKKNITTIYPGHGPPRQYDRQSFRTTIQKN